MQDRAARRRRGVEERPSRWSRARASVNSCAPFQVPLAVEPPLSSNVRDRAEARRRTSSTPHTLASSTAQVSTAFNQPFCRRASADPCAPRPCRPRSSFSASSSPHLVAVPDPSPPRPTAQTSPAPPPALLAPRAPSLALSSPRPPPDLDHALDVLVRSPPSSLCRASLKLTSCPAQCRPGRQAPLHPQEGQRRRHPDPQRSPWCVLSPRPSSSLSCGEREADGRSP